MKLLSFSEGERESWGAVAGESVIDLGKALPQYPTLADFIASDEYARRDEIVGSGRTGPKLSEIRFLPVIPRPEKIVCAVRNYLDHHNEAVAFGIIRRSSCGSGGPRSVTTSRSYGRKSPSISIGKASLRRDWKGWPPHQSG